MADREIKLTQGCITIINESDYKLVSEYSWHAKPDGYTIYARGYLSDPRALVYMHRLIANPPLEYEVDHRDSDGLNNRRSNLRLVTRSQNQANAKPRPGTSKYKGVYFNIENMAWRALIGLMFNNKHRQLHLGYFDVEEEAAAEYDAAARFVFGEYARLNLPSEASEIEYQKWVQDYKSYRHGTTLNQARANYGQEPLP